MADRVTIQVLQMLARAFADSNTFDPDGAFKLLQKIRFRLILSAESHVETAIEASLNASEERDARSSAVARYALQRVIIELDRHLRSKAIKPPAADTPSTPATPGDGAPPPPL